LQTFKRLPSRRTMPGVLCSVPAILRSAPAILWSIALLCSAPAILQLRLGQPNHSVDFNGRGSRFRQIMRRSARHRAARLAGIRRGCGRWPSATTRTARRRTAMPRRARLRWPPLPRAGGAHEKKKERRIYRPRFVGGKVMMPADLHRLHQYMLEVERIDLSDEMRAVVEELWPELAHKLPPSKS